MGTHRLRISQSTRLYNFSSIHFVIFIMSARNLTKEQNYVLENIVQTTNMTELYEKVDGRHTFEPLVNQEDTLGCGLNGKIIRLRNKLTKKIVAMKQLPVCENSMNELTLHYLAQANNDFITKIDSIFLNYNQQTKKQWFYIIMECMEGGDLFDFIEKHSNTGLSEKQVSVVMKMLVDGIFCLHNELGVAHRDLKP